MKGIVCILLVSVSLCSIGGELISNETLQVSFNVWGELLRPLKLFSFQREAPFWMTWRTLVMAEVRILWTLVNLHHTLQHYYHSVCVCNCAVSRSERVYTSTWRRMTVLSRRKCDWWLIHQALDCYSAMYDVFILSSHEFTDWRLHCISVGCKMLYVRSSKMWSSALFTGISLHQCGLHMSCVESHHIKREISPCINSRRILHYCSVGGQCSGKHRDNSPGPM